MVLTNLGLVLQAKVLAGTALVFTKMKVGNGVLGTGVSLPALTDLISPQQVVSITNCSVVSGQATIAGTLTNTGVAAGFMVNEIGVYATDPQAGEILYAIANAGGQCDYLPAGGGAVVVNSLLNVILAVGSASSVTATVNSSIFATQAQLSAYLPLAGGSMAGAINEATVTLASTGIMAIGAALGNTINVTGTTTITAFDTVQAGTKRRLLFTSALTLTNNATSLILPGNANLSINAGDTAEFTSIGGGNWKCTDYQHNAGYLPLTGGAVSGTINEAMGTSIVSAATTNIGAATGNFLQVTGTTTITSLGTAPAGAERTVEFMGTLTITYNSASLIIPGASSLVTNAGDIVKFRSLGSGNWICVGYEPAGACSFQNQKIVNLLAGVNSGDAVNMGQLQPSNRNKLINGGLAINQRSYVSGTALAAGIYAHDRFKAGASGCTYTFAQSGSPLTTATITAGSLQQVIEGLNIVGGTYTLSWAGTAQGRVNGGTYSASPLTVTGITAGSNVTVEFNAGTFGAGQFELGVIATSFEALEYGDLLRKCQRYALLVPIDAVARNCVTNANIGNEDAWLWFPVDMRAVPTIPSITWSLNLAGTPSVLQQTTRSIIWIFSQTTQNSSTYVYNSVAFVITSEL